MQYGKRLDVLICLWLMDCMNAHAVVPVQSYSIYQLNIIIQYIYGGTYINVSTYKCYNTKYIRNMYFKGATFRRLEFAELGALINKVM